jgi:hypothetical protein
MDLTGGPHPSAARERERGKGEEGASWAAGFGPKGRIEGKEKEKAFFFLFFSKQNFQTLFKMKIEFKFLCSKTTHHIKEVLQHVCNKNYYSNFILNFNFSKFIYFPILKMLTK